MNTSVDIARGGKAAGHATLGPKRVLLLGEKDALIGTDPVPVPEVRGRHAGRVIAGDIMGGECISAVKSKLDAPSSPIVPGRVAPLSGEAATSILRVPQFVRYAKLLCNCVVLYYGTSGRERMINPSLFRDNHNGLQSQDMSFIISFLLPASSLYAKTFPFSDIFGASTKVWITFWKKKLTFWSEHAYGGTVARARESVTFKFALLHYSAVSLPITG
jgi:hypothetical protein